MSAIDRAADVINSDDNYVAHGELSPHLAASALAAAGLLVTDEMAACFYTFRLWDGGHADWQTTVEALDRLNVHLREWQRADQ